MKILQKLGLFLPFSLCTVLLAQPLPTRADSTASLFALYDCEEFKVEVWQDRASGEIFYRSTSYYGNLNLTGGTQESTEGVRVYKFRNGDYEYWVWKGTLDDPDAGILEIYRHSDGQQILSRSCSLPE